MKLRFVLLIATLPIAAPAIARDYPAELAGHAVLPAMTFVPPPADAPESCRSPAATPTRRGQRIDTPESAIGHLRPVRQGGAARRPASALPFKGQPVQGLSGIKNLKDGTFLTLTDNGFGSKANSPDAMLMFHVVKPDWKAGAVERVCDDLPARSRPQGAVPHRQREHAQALPDRRRLRHRIDPADRRRAVVRRRVRARS